MSGYDLVARLTSNDIDVRIRATYELTAGDLLTPDVLRTSRENLRSENAELLAITIMRLLVRAKDQESIESALQTLKNSHDSYLVSSVALALTNAARDFPQTSPRIIEALRKKTQSSDGEARAVIEKCLSELYSK